MYFCIPNIFVTYLKLVIVSVKISLTALQREVDPIMSRTKYPLHSLLISRVCSYFFHSPGIYLDVSPNGEKFPK